MGQGNAVFFCKKITINFLMKIMRIFKTHLPLDSVKRYYNKNIWAQNKSTPLSYVLRKTLLTLQAPTPRNSQT